MKDVLHNSFIGLFAARMAEIGLAASVIAVIDLSAKVASWCSEYYDNVKNAKDDIERLQGQTQRLKETLEYVQSLCDSPNGAKLHASQHLRDGVKDCEIYLTQLGGKLAPRTRQKAMSRYGIRALRWPFRSNEVEGIIEKLSKCRDNISFHLQVDQAYVFLSAFCLEQKLTILNKVQKFLTFIKELFSAHSSQQIMLHSTPTLKNIMPGAIKALEVNFFNKYVRGRAILAVNVYTG